VRCYAELARDFSRPAFDAQVRLRRLRPVISAESVGLEVRAKPLARALYKLVDVGQEIPEQFYSAVAEILAYVYELSGKLKQRKAG